MRTTDQKNKIWVYRGKRASSHTEHQNETGLAEKPRADYIIEAGSPRPKAQNIRR
jgi:hypothetical protein